MEPSARTVERNNLETELVRARRACDIIRAPAGGVASRHGQGAAEEGRSPPVPPYKED